MEYYNTSAKKDLEKKYYNTAGYRIWRRNTTILQDTGSREGVLQ